MAINISQAFKRTSANPVDESLTLTKAQMLAVNDNLMPSKYFTIGQDDGYIYLYDKANTVDPTTGKFRKFEGGGGTGGASELSELEDVLLTSLSNGQTLIWDETEAKWVNADFPSGSNERELTQAEYDALSEQEKMNGTTYFITDGEGGGTSSVQKATLNAGATTASFNYPTTGDYIADVYVSDGRCYTSVDTSVSGTVTFTFTSSESDATVFMELKEV